MVNSRGGASVLTEEKPGRLNIRQAATYGLGQAEVPVEPAAANSQEGDARRREQAGPSLLEDDDDERPRMAPERIPPLRVPPSDARGLRCNGYTQKAQRLEEWTQIWTR